MIRGALPLCMTLAVAACGAGQTPTRATAERLCADEARQADGVSGSVGIGGGTGGPFAGGSVTITSDILNPRSEQEALASCVDRRLNNRPAPRGGGLTIGISAGGAT